MADVITFGCRLNTYESEVMRDHAIAAGLEDTVIVNTCAVTAEAERQARQSIRRLRRERPNARIIVTGCAVQIGPESFAAMPEVDHVIGNDKKMDVTIFQELGRDRNGNGGAPLPLRERLGEGLAQHIPTSDFVETTPPLTPSAYAKATADGAGDKTLRSFSVGGPAGGGEFIQRLRQEREVQRAFVQVQNGCDHRCTFCIIPYGRGPSRSVPIGVIAEQLRTLVAQGYNEVVLTGVDIASYGGDLPGQPRLGQMIRRVLALAPELRRLRLSSLDPAALDDDLWHLIANEPRLMPHLHLSVQAGDDMILKRMKRRHLRADVITLCDRARRLRPDVVFGADIIAGFPTETDAMFDNTYNLMKDCRFTWLHVFPYSARKGTPAAKMPQVHGTIRKERAERLRSLGAEAARSHLEALVGQKVEVLVEQQGLGCTPQFAKIKLADQAPVGGLVNVECFAQQENQIVARVL